MAAVLVAHMDDSLVAYCLVGHNFVDILAAVAFVVAVDIQKIRKLIIHFVFHLCYILPVDIVASVAFQALVAFLGPPNLDYLLQMVVDPSIGLVQVEFDLVEIADLTLVVLPLEAFEPLVGVALVVEPMVADPLVVEPFVAVELMAEPLVAGP